ncbi:MAG TPA: mechanosensitive ion channel [Candidatus Sulfomarinibacteraceae bacterium]|nr:mechanosensitive ion channel [Candidatus Sulfomarinibacteraceae bacterium]
MQQQIDGLSVTLQELLTRFVLFLPRLVVALVIFIAGLYLVSVLTRLMKSALERRQVNPEAIKVITQVAHWSLIVMVAVTALQQIEFNLTAFITGLGVIGFTVGFALKDISENFVAGLMLLLQRPFDLGDVVLIDEYRGRVTDVTLRATEIDTLDGQNLILPNGLVYTSPILNYSRRPLSRVAVDVGVGYDSDLDVVRRTALEAIARAEHVLKDPAPYVVFKSFGDSSIDFTLFYWVDSRQTPQFRASDMAIPLIKEAFEEAGIDIPFPIRTVLLPREHSLN